MEILEQKNKEEKPWKTAQRIYDEKLPWEMYNERIGKWVELTNGYMCPVYCVKLGWKIRIKQKKLSLFQKIKSYFGL
jgi:hypothetical protein